MRESIRKDFEQKNIIVPEDLISEIIRYKKEINSISREAQKEDK